jgi:hypothetical protein
LAQGLDSVPDVPFPKPARMPAIMDGFHFFELNPLFAGKHLFPHLKEKCHGYMPDCIGF